MNNLHDKCLVKISNVIKSQFEFTDYQSLVSDPAFRESVKLIRDNSYLINNALLGYISYRKSNISRLYHRRFTKDEKYRQLLASSSVDPVYSIENFIKFAFDNTKIEFNNVCSMAAKIQFDSSIFYNYF